MQNKLDLIKRSVGASVLISLGCYVLLKIGNPIGPILFSLGLLSVCYMNQNLFTGKCGFIFQDKIPYIDLIIILCTNLLTGYLLGYIYSFADLDIYNNALSKAILYECSISFFIKSILCGVTMYIAVYLYRKGSPLGIIIGIPLFIFAGFQHCIANIITLGIARTLSLSNFLSMIICIIGNFLGSLLMWFLTTETTSKN